MIEFPGRVYGIWPAAQEQGRLAGFNKPVEVALDADHQVRALGFITRGDLQNLGLADSVAVYLPQSYNFAGNLLIVTRDRVIPLAADPAEIMKLIVSGGVSSR